MERGGGAWKKEREKETGCNLNIQKENSKVKCRQWKGKELKMEKVEFKKQKKKRKEYCKSGIQQK